MQIQDIEHQILELIQEVYGEKYIGKLKVEALPLGYCVTLGMADTQMPITIYAELNDQDFINYFRKELKTMGLNKVMYRSLQLIDPPKYIDIPCQKTN